MKTDITCRIFTSQDFADVVQRQALVKFLEVNLERFGDPAEQIEAALAYCFSDAEGKGGLVVTAEANGNLAGAAVVNHTGMDGYIPANQLVYIAVRADARGQGIGKALMNYVLDHSQGDMALHVEYDNPARHLYEALGFTSKYMEMRRIGGHTHG